MNIPSRDAVEDAIGIGCLLSVLLALLAATWLTLGSA